MLGIIWLNMVWFICKFFFRWYEHSFPVGRVQQDFKIVLEVVPGSLMSTPTFPGAHIAIDNLRMSGCFAEMSPADQCSKRQMKCLYNKVSFGLGLFIV